MNLVTISNKEGTATAAVEEGPAPAPLELPGLTLSTHKGQGVGVECLVLTCEANAAVEPLHSGGDVHWLGYVAEGSVELGVFGDDAKGFSAKARDALFETRDELVDVLAHVVTERRTLVACVKAVLLLHDVLRQRLDPAREGA